MNPITGIAGCCARPASGYAAAEQRDESTSLHPRPRSVLGFQFSPSKHESEMGDNATRCAAKILSRPCLLWVKT
jgi:hypothetical protein